MGTKQALLLVMAVVAGLALAAVALVGPPSRAAAQTECISTIDLMLVLDGSESISAADFELMRTFAGDLAGHFTISPDDVHAGIVQFAGEGQGRVEIGLSSDAAAVQGAVAAMTQIVGATDIQEGIALAQGELAAGARSGVPRALIVLTDGAHNQPGDEVAEAEAARAAGTEIFAIAVGSGPDLGQLGAIASDPDSEHVFSVGDFEALVTILDPLVQVVCPPPPTPEPTIEEEPPEAEGPPADADSPSNEVLGVRALPATGSRGLPDDWLQRGLWLLVQAVIGLGSASALVAGTYWVGRRRAGR